MKAHLETAQGYLELGMHVDANNALDEIESTLMATPEVLAVRLQIYLKAKKWNMVLEISRHLAKLQPENANWFVEWAKTRCQSEYYHFGENMESKVLWLILSLKRLETNQTRNPNPPNHQISIKQMGSI
jgi:lipopolysaccharide biosynthesis regulator YciM